MRLTLLALTAAALLSAAPASHAAPTCQDRNGDTIRCATDGAMPVGWTLPAEARLQQQLSKPPEPLFQELFGPFCFIIGFFALIALLPDFDGWTPGDWDRQGTDDEEQS